jgi:release factor glutamine methyltransferase
MDLLFEPERELSEPERSAYREFVKRRAGREPAAHILGFWGFYKRDFRLSSDVLTPRSETELLADRAVSWSRSNGAKTAADIGTGSGCLAVTLALEVPGLRVVATDVSESALEIARANAETLGASGNVDFRAGDLLEPLAAEPGGLDLVVSNPPYIPSGDVDGLMPEVARFEPRLALDGGEDGLDCYRRLVPGCARVLRPGGALIMEIGEEQGGAVRSLIEESGHYRDIEITPDLNGLDRIVFAVCK